MAQLRVIGNDPIGPVAERVDARAVQCSLSWFKSRPGLQPSLLTQLRLGKPYRSEGCRGVARRAKPGLT